MPNEPTKPCQHPEKFSVSGKCSDMSSWQYANNDTETSAEGEGYVPHGLGFGGGHYLEVTVCMTCGKVLDLDVDAIRKLAAVGAW